MSILVQIIWHAIASALFSRGMKRPAMRWIFAIIFTLFALIFVVLALPPVDNQTEQLVFAIGAGFFSIVALILWISAIRYRSGANALREQTRANVKQLIAEGKIVTIPAATTAVPKGVNPDAVASVERYIQQVRDIFEKNKPTVNEYEAPALFRKTQQELHGITGRYDLILSGPAMTFASLPKPWRDVGAAEVMYRLSYVRGSLYVPAGLRQGLLYAFHAQFFEPLQPDALLVQLRLQSAYNIPSWREKTAKTMDILNRYAANNPLLPASEMIYRQRIGQYDRALECADLAVNGFLSPTESAAILDTKASILQSLKRNDEAVDAFKSALSYFPNPWTWHNLSILLDKMGRYQEALDANSRALAMMNFGMAQQVRATILSHMRQPQV
jgi:tetratricopeptide (TPR) repeat protein